MLANSPNSAAALPNSNAAPLPDLATLRPDAALVAGIAAYRRHPYQRDLPDPPTLWQEGDSRILDFAVPKATGPAATGPVVLFVPSLVNRATILDLAPSRSMLRHLAAQGVRAALLDWGWPGPVERRFNLTDYVAGRLERAIAAFAAPVILVGYCMGGLLAVAAALRRPDRVAALGLLATPWDFHAADPAMPRLMTELMPRLELALAGGTLPIDALQSLFALLDPGAIAAKYRAFATLDQDSDRARMFVALEDWLADGVPLPAPVARDCLGGWYRDNQPARGEWRIAGQVVDPAALRIPAFVATPARDRIVPVQSARRLAALIPGAVVHEPPTGHVAMVAGARAETLLWDPLRDWLGKVSVPI